MLPHSPMQLYGSLPCYQLERPLRWQQPAIGNYRVLKKADEANINVRLPFDTNWGRADYLPILPLDATLQANSDTFAAPNAVPLDSQYKPLAYENWDPMHATHQYLPRVDERFPTFLADAATHAKWKHL